MIIAIACLLVSWYYAIGYLSTQGRKLQHSDFYPLWNGGTAIRQGISPYGQEVTKENQIAAYGTTADAIGEKNQQRFAYPLFAIFPLFPLCLLHFHVANELASWIMTGLALASVGWLRGKWDRNTVLYVLLALSSYPLILALQIRQPTLFFFGMAVASIALLRHGRFIPAGILAALSTGKPQVAFAVLLPMLIWTIVRWRERKWFAISLATSQLILLAGAFMLMPRWAAEWLGSLRAYSQYLHPSTVVFFLGDMLGLILTVVLLLGLAVALWMRRETDLLFLIALSVTIVHLIVPVEVYSAVILMIPVIWVADNADLIQDCGEINQLALALVRVALAELWLANVVAAVLLHTSPAGKSIAWWLPVNAVFPVVASLVAMMIVQLVHGEKRAPTAETQPCRA